VFVAKEAGAKRLALFHHDPARDDESLDEVLRGLQASLGESGPAGSGVEVLAAAEGLTISFEEG
jgi:phosphoribosyl 1,2-cyclic phosphodiesterase